MAAVVAQPLAVAVVHTGQGRPPGGEIRRGRLASAKRLLADPRLSVGEVAQRCGFGQQSKFSNFFRRQSA